MEGKAKYKTLISKHNNNQLAPQARIPPNNRLIWFHISKKFASGFRSTTTKENWGNWKSHEKICFHHHWTLQKYKFPRVATTHLEGIFAKLEGPKATRWAWSHRSRRHCLSAHCLQLKQNNPWWDIPAGVILELISPSWQTFCKLIY